MILPEVIWFLGTATLHLLEVTPSWSWIDLILVVLLIGGFLSGMRKGLVSSLTSLVALLLAVYAALHFYSSTADFLRPWLKVEESSLKAIAIVVSFLMVFLLVKILGGFLKEFVRFIALGGVDKLMGGVLGFLKSALILCFVLVLFESVNGKEGYFLDHENLENSKVYPAFLDFGKKILPAITEQLNTRLEKDEN